jgi:predicted CXXCH cytochrome family protein
MTVLRVFFAVSLLAAIAVPALAGVDQCLVCHTAQGDKASTAFKKDVHHDRGVTCAGCHGGDSSTEDMEKAMDSTKGFRGVMKGDNISRACAACHSDSAKMASFGAGIPTGQWEKLQASVHGRLIGKDGSHVMQCTSCHGNHGVAKVKSPASPVYPTNVVATCTKCHANASFMRTFNPKVAVDQLDKYRTSVHGVKNAAGDIKPAQCASCHGSHDILGPADVKSHVFPANIPSTCARCHSDRDYMAQYGIPTDQYDKFARSVHGKALLEKHDLGAPACNGCHGNHGAAPPGVASISNVCGTCHAINAELFAGSPHKSAFDRLNKPECETCHSNHEIMPVSKAMLGIQQGAVCATCHSGTANPLGFAAATTMRSLVDSLDFADSIATVLVDEAEQKGMEIGEAKFRLRDIRQARMESRTVVHAFSLAKFRPVVEKGMGLAARTRAEAEEAIKEYSFRRVGLGVSTLIITLLAIALYSLIKRIEQKQKKAA